MARTSDNGGRRGGNPRPRRGDDPSRRPTPTTPTSERSGDTSGPRGGDPEPRPSPDDPSRPVSPMPEPDPRTGDTSGPRGGDLVGRPRTPGIQHRPGPSGPPTLVDAPPNPNPSDMPRYYGDTTYLSADGEAPTYEDYLPAEPPIQEFAAPTPYTPRYVPTQGTGGPEFRSSGTGQQLSENDRLMTQHEANALDQDYVTDLNYNAGQEARYGQQADDAYGPLLRGEGGYTADEASGIRNFGGMEGLQLTPDQIDAMQLQGYEQDAIKGDPYRTMAYYNPEVQRSVQDEGQKRRNEATSYLQSTLNDSIDPAALSLRDGFENDLTGAVDTTEGQIANYLDPSQLNVSQQFLNDYQMSPEEQQRIVTSAGMDVRDRYQSQIDDMGRRARAEGVNAAGAAAMQSRLQREAASGAGDQMTRARVQADAAAADRMARGEDMRLRYGQNLAGMQTDAALQVGNQRRSALTTGEQMRLDANRDIGNRRFDAARIGGQAGMDTADRNAATSLENERFLMQTGMQGQQQADDRASDRAQAVATNRQDVTRYGQATRYGQGMDINQAQSGRNQQVADARRQDSQEARGYVTGRQGQSQQAVQAGLNRRGDLYATRAGAVGRNTGNKIQAEGTPGKGERIVSGIIGAAGSVAGGWLGGKAQGGVVTQPTYALVGEAGPEAIVPLTGEDPEVLPGIAMQYGQEPFTTAPMPSRKAPAYGKQLRYAG